MICGLSFWNLQADIAKVEDLGGNAKKEIDGEYKLDVERFAKAISAWEVCVCVCVCMYVCVCVCVCVRV